MVEWYHYPFRFEEQKDVATKRISKLVRITALEPHLADMRILTSPGYVETFDSNGVFVLGFLFTIPPGADLMRTPESLESLFKKDSPHRSSNQFSLRQKFILANQLATCLAAFHRVHWYHKNFCSKSIVFFYSTDGTLLVDHPYICGFGFSRPDDPKEISLNPDWEMHIHPELQPADVAKRPKFQRRHDIYSLGVLLFDIGTWGSAKNYLTHKNGNVTPRQFRHRLENYCKDLKGLMGEEYMAVTRWCLRPETPNSPVAGSAVQISEGQVEGQEEEQISLEIFYWRVLHELAGCHCSPVARG